MEIKMKNKIKGSLYEINKKHILTVFFSSLAVCLILRFYQAAKLIDHTTGFYIKNSFITVLFYLILFASSLAILLMSFISSNVKELKNKYIKKNKALGTISILSAISFLIDFFDQLAVSLGGSQKAATDNGFPFTMSSGVIPARIQIFFALLSVLYFIIIAIRIFTGKEILRKYKILCTAPIGWATIKLVSLFATQISFIRVSDLFLEIVTNSFAAIFFLSYAQSISGVYEKEARWRMTGAGLVFSLVALITQIPRFIFTISGKTDLVNNNYIVNYAVLMLALFSIVLIFTVFKNQESLHKETEIKIPEEDDSSEETDNK